MQNCYKTQPQRHYVAFFFTGIMDECYAQFSHPEVIPVRKVGPIHVVELWHGPTGAFKDLALSVVGRLADHFLKKQGKRATVLVGTSGDTGSAAIHSVLGSKNIDIVVLYPKGRVTRVQELQMTTVNAPNVKVYSVVGTSDDADIPIKKLFADAEFIKKHTLLSLNSINVGRVLFQAVHFIYTYLRVCPAVDKEVLFSIPSGGLGNITGGYIAYLMGLPIRFLAAVNENDVVHRALHSGEFSLSDEVQQTYASAMDIQIPYNIERLFYFMSGGNCDMMRGIMEQFERKGSCSLPSEILESSRCVSTTRVGMEETLSTIQHVWKEFNYLLCPHSAIGMHAALQYLQKLPKDADSPGRSDIVVLATATPAKFPDVYTKIGIDLPLVPAIAELHCKPEVKSFMERGEDWEGILRQEVERLAARMVD